MMRRGGVTGLWVLWALSSVLCARVEAQTPVVGDWTLMLGKRTLLVLQLRVDGPQCSGTMARPEHMTTRDFASFSQVSGPVKVRPLRACIAKDGAFRFVVQDSDDANDTSTYLLRVRDVQHAELGVEGVPLPPMQLVRAGGAAKVSGDWDAARTYTPEDDAPSNPEMKRIFDEDQRVRQTWPNIDWDAVNKSDAGRRTETRKLLAEGALRSGEDFCWAAFIFQHGSGPDDFLLAHTLSAIAVKKGYSAAIWIMSATLDRYLQSIKQSQIYGTQFMTPGVVPATQEPYNRTLISDALRRELDVPSQAEQDAQRQKYDADRHLPPAAQTK